MLFRPGRRPRRRLGVRREPPRHRRWAASAWPSSRSSPTRRARSRRRPTARPSTRRRSVGQPDDHRRPRTRSTRRLRRHHARTGDDHPRRADLPAAADGPRREVEQDEDGATGSTRTARSSTPFGQGPAAGQRRLRDRRDGQPARGRRGGTLRARRHDALQHGRQPASGKVYVSNTDAHNDVRFEGHTPGFTSVRGNIVDSRITVIDPDDDAVVARRT